MNWHCWKGKCNGLLSVLSLHHRGLKNRVNLLSGIKKINLELHFPCLNSCSKRSISKRTFLLLVICHVCKRSFHHGFPIASMPYTLPAHGKFWKSRLQKSPFEMRIQSQSANQSLHTPSWLRLNANNQLKQLNILFDSTYLPAQCTCTWN